MNLWPVEHFCPPFFSRSALIWKKTGDKSVQLVRGSFLSKYFLQNPYFRYKYIYFCYHSSSASCTWKLNRPSKPEDISFEQPITQTALPHCIAIDILWNRKKVDNFSPEASWIFCWSACLKSYVLEFDNSKNISTNFV